MEEELYVPADRIEEYLDDIKDYLQLSQKILLLAEMPDKEKVNVLTKALSDIIDKREPTLEERED